MVITVTLNPCVDRTIEVEKFQYGGTNKVLMTRNDISGKGINVNLVYSTWELKIWLPALIIRRTQRS